MANMMVMDFYTKSVSLQAIVNSLSPITLDIQVSYKYFSVI